MTSSNDIPERATELRLRAEEDLRRAAKLPQDHLALSPEETRRTLHELRVHQIELEMQNTELRRAQVQLAVERRRYFNLYDQAPVAYCTVSEQGLLLETNLNAAILLEIPRGDAVGQPVFTRFIAKEAQDIYYLQRRRLFATLEPQSCELPMVTSRGRIFWADMQTTAAKDENGILVCRIVLNDISERKQAEKRLQESEARFRKLFECHSAVKLVLETETGNILDANDAAVRFYGWSVEELKHMHLQQIISQPTEEVQTYKSKSIAAEHTVGEFRHRRADGSIRDVEVFSNRIEIEGKSLLYSIVHDITDRKLAEKSSLEMERKLLQTEKLESLGILAGGIAHDFNNILSIILGHCNLMDEDIDAGLDVKTHVNLIEKAANRAADLCWQMLTYSGNTAMIQTLVNLRSIVAETVKLLQPSIKESVAIELDLVNALSEIIGDSAQIQQVLMNLVINAAEAIGDRNGVITIALSERTVEGEKVTDFLGNTIPSGNYACLTVSDTGSGMDGTTQKRLFEPFYTTKFNGRGLGMSPVLGIIKSHGGALQLSTQPGVGTTFIVYFPIFTVSARVETVPPIKAFPAVGLLQSLKGSGTILLVENEDSLRTIGSALLKAMGFSTMTATNGDEALKIWREYGDGIDLILLGMTTPETAGIDTYRLLRKISPAIPIVIGSGCSAESFTQGFTLDPFSARVRKPYKPDELRDTFRKLLDKKEDGFHDKAGK
jgi:PAS domain S-box-containing protein